MKFTIITLFEDALRPYLDTSMMRKAQEKGIVEFNFVNLRDFGLGPHKSVDDTPYGGGDGMLLRCEPVYAAVEAVKKSSSPHLKPEVILPTPDGMPWNQALARQFAGIAVPDMSTTSLENSITKKSTTSPESPSSSATTPSDSSSQPSPSSHLPSPSSAAPSAHFVILCPHYEGYDARILHLVDHRISLGNYVLTGGELPALVIIDSIVRLLPGVLGGNTSAAVESFSDGDNLEFPQYTKPADFRGLKVPPVLLSGDHGKVAAWRRAHVKSASNSSNLL